MPTRVCCLPGVCGRCLRLAARPGARRTDRKTARLAARFLARENPPPIAPCPKYFERPLVLFLSALPPLLYSFPEEQLTLSLTLVSSGKKMFHSISPLSTGGHRVWTSSHL